jgi:hypothetical protein
MQSQALRLKSQRLEWKSDPLEAGGPAGIADFLAAHPQPLSGYTFASLVSWDPIFQYGWLFPEPGTLFLSCLLGPDRQRHLMQPVGRFSGAAQDQLRAEAELLPYPLRIIGVSQEFLERHADFARRFEVREDDTASNYIYLTRKLAQLPGRKYARKRNLIAQASVLYNWTSEPVSPSNTSGCLEVLQRIWTEEQPENNDNLQQELTALDRTLRLWRVLGQNGILWKVDGRPAAFAIFEPISPTTVAVHFERALRCYKGLYQVVNFETANFVGEQTFEFINREEDLGSGGLREAKRSYYPERLMSAYEIVMK